MKKNLFLCLTILLGLTVRAELSKDGSRIVVEIDG